MTIEVQQILGEPDHARRLVQHDDASRSEQRTRFLHGIKTGWHVELVRQQQGHGRSAGNDGLETVSVANPACEAVDQLAERRVHRRFVHARTLDVPAHAIELGPAVLLRAERREGLRPAQENDGDVAERLDVVHRRRALIETGDGRERRLDSRLRALPFQRLEQRRFLARFVRARSAVHVDLAVEIGAQDAAAGIAGGVGFLDGALENMLHVHELAPDVDVGDLGADRVAADEASFEQQVRIALHQHMILERARLALVGIAGEIFRLRRVLQHELPLHAGGKARTAAAAEPGLLHGVDHLIRLHRQSPLEAFVAFVAQVEVERVGTRLANETREDGLERHRASGSRLRDQRSPATFK